MSSSRAPLFEAAPEAAIPGQYIVVFKDGTAMASMGASMNRLMLADDANHVERTFSIIPAFSARLDARTVDELRRDPNIRYIEQNRIIELDAVHDSPADGIDRADQRKGRNNQYDDHDFDGTGVHVYIVDTGIRTTHTEFTGRIGSGSSSVEDGNGVEDCNGHGTHVASSSAGTSYGMAKGATLHPVRVLNCQGSGTTAGVIAGIDFVRTDCPNQDGPCVANMSLGGGAAQALDDAVANAVAAGIPFAVAAGNENQNACNVSPAREPTALTVGAVDDNDGRASFSNYGSCVDIFAPGVSILGAWKDSDTATNSISGTSMASPHVAGAIAQYLQAYPDATPADVEAAMESAATPNCVSGAGAGSPNLLLFNDFDQAGEGQGCSGSAPPPGEPPGGGNSCQGHCNGKAPGGCHCDFLCMLFGDCCADMLESCMS